MEFVLDSGFDGDLIIPADLVTGLDTSYLGEHPFALADQSYRTCAVHEIYIDWEGEERRPEVAIMDGNPLVGIGVLLENLIHMELTQGGEVLVEPS